MGKLQSFHARRPQSAHSGRKQGKDPGNMLPVEKFAKKCQNRDALNKAALNKSMGLKSKQEKLQGLRSSFGGGQTAHLIGMISLETKGRRAWRKAERKERSLGHQHIGMMENKTSSSTGAGKDPQLENANAEQNAFASKRSTMFDDLLFAYACAMVISFFELKNVEYVVAGGLDFWIKGGRRLTTRSRENLAPARVHKSKISIILRFQTQQKKTLEVIIFRIL